MGMGSESALLTELWMSKTLCTTMCRLTLMAKVTCGGSPAFIFKENGKIVIPMREPIIQDIISSLVPIN